MEKPSQMATFDALYGIAAKSGRGEALFGSSIELARPAYQKALIGEGYPSAYLEFPLLGEACFDLLVVHDAVEPGARFAPGGGFGYQRMIDWFAGLDKRAGTVSCGLELDCGSGETECAGAYLQQRRRTDLVAPFLESLGEGLRARSYEEVCSRMPAGWPPSYVGLFPGREGAPLRIGGYLSDRVRRTCAEDPAELARAFDTIGFEAYDAPMLARCARLMRLAPSVDFQFDVMADGTLGDTFGLSLSFNEAKPKQARECMECGYGARILGRLERWGLADRRWRLIEGAAFARSVEFARSDGSVGRLAMCVLLNYAKVKFTCAQAQPAKFYLILRSGELDG